MPGRLQEKALLRVHILRIPRCYVEEQRVEAVHALDKTAPLAITALLALGIKIRSPVPALRRNLPDTVAALPQVFPERLQRGGFRVAAGHTNNGDVVQLHRRFCFRWL